MNICEVCGVEFVGRKGRPNRFCGRVCHLAATKLIITKTCVVCGIKFEGYPDRQVCSVICVHQQMRLPKRPCAGCGIEFSPEKDSSKYCSWTCMCLDRTSRPGLDTKPDDIPGARHIALTKGEWAIIDDVDFAKVSIYAWHSHVGKGTTYARARRVIDGIRYVIHLHHLILDVPPGSDIIVDHRNGNGLDCRKENLCITTKSQNRMNVTKKRGKSPYKGVSVVGSRFKASIRANNQSEYLGYFDSAEEAARAYDVAARRVHGTHGRYNFPGPGERAARSTEIMEELQKTEMICKKLK